MAEWIASNWYWLLPLIGIIGGAVVKLTPTKKDDAWWDKIKEVYRSVFDKKDKQ